LPNGQTIASTHTCELQLPGLPPAARKAHLFPALAGHSLLSIGQLCDQGCDVTFSPTSVAVDHNNSTVLTGHRDANGLWAVPLRQLTLSANADANVPSSANLREIIKYLHASCFSPPKSTWIDAIRNGHFTTWPALTTEAITKLLPPTVATALGHLKQQRKNLHSTQPKPESPPLTTTKPPSPNQANDDDLAPPPLPDGKRTNAIYAAVTTINTPTGSIASDQTGRFPVTSATGMKYVIIVYDYDSNNILAEPLLNLGAKTILTAFKKLHALLVSRGLRPQLHRLDNEACNILKEFLIAAELDYQLAPPGIHRRNSAERAIQTWKDHFITGLCTTNPHFPIYLWDKLIPQANTTLNLLR
jgi:hypothetical protein